MPPKGFRGLVQQSTYGVGGNFCSRSLRGSWICSVYILACRRCCNPPSQFIVSDIQVFPTASCCISSRQDVCSACVRLEMCTQHALSVMVLIIITSPHFVSPPYADQRSAPPTLLLPVNQLNCKCLLLGKKKNTPHL